MTLKGFSSLFGALIVTTVIAAGARPAVAAVHKVERGGAVIEYHVDGKGPVVLMIASLGRPATDFDALSAYLVEAGYTTIRPQPRGIGGSVGPMKGLTLRDLAADALATGPADSGPIVVIGHAFGQRVARMLATLHPDRVKGVVMIAAGGKAPMRPGAREALLGVFDPELSPEKHLEAVSFAFFAPGNDAAVWRDGWHGAVATMQIEATQAQKVEQWWAAGEAPLLVVQGLQDVVAPPENGRMIKDEFGARATLHEIDDAGHAMLPERPKQIAELVTGFVDRVSR